MKYKAVNEVKGGEFRIYLACTIFFKKNELDIGCARKFLYIFCGCRSIVIYIYMVSHIRHICMFIIRRAKYIAANNLQLLTKVQSVASFGDNRTQKKYLFLFKFILYSFFFLFFDPKIIWKWIGKILLQYMVRECSRSGYMNK